MHFKMASAICFNLDQSEIMSSGNGLVDLQKPIHRGQSEPTDLGQNLLATTNFSTYQRKISKLNDVSSQNDRNKPTDFVVQI